jgi:AraC-like DNA-binding protein
MLLLPEFSRLIEPKVQAKSLLTDHQVVISTQLLVNQYYKHEKNLLFYSRQLQTDLVNLNRLLKKYLGRTLHLLIQDRIHQEAEQLLVHSTLSCKQITFELNVSDPPYFTRCFKQRTGLTPTQFREKYQALPDLRVNHN